MPTQSRGFWACDYCTLKFDTFDEAKSHEIEQCSHRTLQQTPLQPAAIRRDPYSLSRMGAISAPAAEMADYNPQRYKSRCVRLMGPNDVSSLAISDAVSCQNLELFEANHHHVAENDTRRIGGVPVSTGQLGLRCVNCVHYSGQILPSIAANSMFFPVSIENIAESVRMMADRHLRNCDMTPRNVHDVLDEAATKRQQESEGRLAQTEDDARNTIALNGYCVQFCERMGIVNKLPSRTGITFSDMEVQNIGTMHQRFELPRGAIAHPAERHSSVPAAPSGHRQSSHMIGTMGSDPLAPTPLARRRERQTAGEGGDPCSVDREGIYSGYPNPFSHASGPHETQYGGHDEFGGYAPAQPMSRLEGSQETPMPTPHPLHPSEASPVPSYQQPPPYDLPGNFPFYQEPNGSWICKFCSHLHPQFRDPHWMWSSHDHAPPPGHFIDHHLSICRAYHQTIPHQHMPQQGPPPSYPYLPTPQHQMGYGAPPTGWDTPGHPPAHPRVAQRHTPPIYSTPGPSGDGLSYPYPPHAEPPPPPGRYTDLPSPGIPPQRTSGQQPMAKRHDTADVAVQQALDYLAAADKEMFTLESRGNASGGQLVMDDDRLLLTDYFFYLMKQLRLCRFSESDRKTRGGKREKIKVGYGGLQCVHCADAPNSRKFFWSNVDRLANSFAEIPGHIIKCRRCPQQTKDALMQLKQLHPEQMARLPRGSQKVFFRRMWRRLHDEDPDQGETPEELEKPAKMPPSMQEEAPKSDTETKQPAETQDSPAGTIDSDESILLLDRPPQESARALANSLTASTPPSPSSRVLLAIPDDKEWLSDMDCFIRKQLEVFCATEDDVSTAQSDRKYPVHVGQVGIRCIHCALSKGGVGARGTGVAYPFSVSGIYESVREFQRLHLDSCENLPKGVKLKLAGFKGSSSLSSVLRKYYVVAAKALGLQDTRDGIRAGADSVPLGSQVAFAFSEGGSPLAEDVRVGSSGSSVPLLEAGPSITPLESRKRKSSREEPQHVDTKRPFTDADREKM